MRQVKRGARPTPRHKLAAAVPFHPKGTVPSQIIVVPPFLEMWLNDQYGDCVTAEEAFAKAAFSVMSGVAETKISDATVMTFCNAGGFLDGANLTDVMDAMKSTGFIQDGMAYKDGPYLGVDYSAESVLQNAIAQGPVKIGIDANALPSGAGNGNGWYASGGSPGEFSNEDHCVSLCGYGPVAALFAALGVPLPSSLPSGWTASTVCYLLYTWSSIGVVDHSWIMSTCGEAWLRNPTTPGLLPPPPPPPPAAAQLNVPAGLPAGSYTAGPVMVTTSAAELPGVYPLIPVLTPPGPPTPGPSPATSWPATLTGSGADGSTVFSYTLLPQNEGLRLQAIPAWLIPMLQDLLCGFVTQPRILATLPAWMQALVPMICPMPAVQRAGA